MDKNVFPLENIRTRLWTSAPKYQSQNTVYNILHGYFVRYSIMGIVHSN